MFQRIAYALRNLTRFAGRDSRETFWVYAVFILLVTFIATFALAAPVIADSFERMQQFALAHPDQATITRTPTSYSIQIHGQHPELMPDFPRLLHLMALPVGLAVLLLSAAVTRRLHDRGRSGIWALPPLAFLVIGMSITPSVFATMAASPGAPPKGFVLLFGANLLYIVSLGLLVLQLIGATAPNPNRFGGPPAE
ncbi:hypothetical protein DJ017_08295 [Phenylobacterium soli]|uniref:DUF805 domain-containing protein n=2 Tax=Phenylobacterium soli TaxID=2170551 RepID=A0A328API9_9CAUL|nr:hypothetical protein DJ017_08295 [Phenylobacterium soli]